MKKKIILCLVLCLGTAAFTGRMMAADRQVMDKKKMAQPVTEEFLYHNENRNMFYNDVNNLPVGQLFSEEQAVQQEQHVYDETVAKTRTLSSDLDSELLTYEATSTFEQMSAAEGEELYGIYDQYTDADESSYYYLHGTDELCMYMEEFSYEGADERPVQQVYTEDQIRAAAEDYLMATLGTDIETYHFYKTEYQEQKKIYLATYIRRLGDYITDDTLTVFLDENAAVYAFSALNRDRYHAYTEEDIDETSLQEALSLVEAGEYSIDDIRICMDGETSKLMAILPK